MGPCQGGGLHLLLAASPPQPPTPTPAHTSVLPAFKALGSFHPIPGVLPTLRGSAQLCLQPLQLLEKNQ